jgi:outer membrane lipoprotein-sorting protein
MKWIPASLLLLAAGLAASAARAQIPARALSADAVLDQVDRNAFAGTKVMTSEMTIHGRRDSRTVKSKSWIRGEDDGFTEYLDPPRERGTKMLKLGDQLWTYSPDTDRIIAISGHMLRQSVMGSDLSYEDLMEDRRLRKAYDAKVDGEDTIIGRPCWVLLLTSKGGDVAYESRKIEVDKERFLVLK